MGNLLCPRRDEDENLADYGIYMPGTREHAEIMKSIEAKLDEDYTESDTASLTRIAKFLPRRGVRKCGKRFQVVDWDFNRDGRKWGTVKIKCYPNKTSIARAVQRLLNSLPNENKLGTPKRDIQWFQLSGDYMTGSELREICVHISY